MIKETAKKILPRKIYDRLKKVVKPEQKTKYYSLPEIQSKLSQFGIRKAAILTDSKTNLREILRMPSLEIQGVYSFDLSILGSAIEGFEVKPLIIGDKIETDGWIVSSLNETTTFSLNKYLLENELEDQTIIQHVISPNSTKYYSNADFFSNEQTTTIHINNYFRRCYALPFPLDLRLTLRSNDGKIIKTKQIILAPDKARIIKSEEFGLKNFFGYIELEFEITKKVVPFLHYMIDYESQDLISSNHQSGLGLHPANSKFTRGYVPTEKDKTLELCLFQHNYEQPIIVNAFLHYTDHGEQKVVKKSFQPLHKKQMLFQDVKTLFTEVDFSKIISPYIEVQSELPLHRPNYYYAVKGKKGYYDTSHAGPDLSNHIRLAYGGNPTITKKEKDIFDKYKIENFDIRHCIFPKEAEIDSIITIGGNDTTQKITDFKINLFDPKGAAVASLKASFDFDKERYLNLNEFLKSKNLDNFSGTISFRSGNPEQALPISANSITGYIHKHSNYLTSTSGSGSHPNNIPFYFRGGPPNYLRMKCSAGTTDIFARGVSNDQFDTFYTVTFPTANNNLRQSIKYEIQIINSSGEKKNLYRELASNGCDVLKLSDLISQSGHNSPGGYYTVWFFSSEAYLYAQHILYRKSDSAIALEHCYAGKFGL